MALSSAFCLCIAIVLFYSWKPKQSKVLILRIEKLLAAELGFVFCRLNSQTQFLTAMHSVSKYSISWICSCYFIQILEPQMFSRILLFVILMATNFGLCRFIPPRLKKKRLVVPLLHFTEPVKWQSLCECRFVRWVKQKECCIQKLTTVFCIPLSLLQHHRASDF